MSLGTVLLIVLVLLLIGAFPSWPHSSSWGYGPVGGLGAGADHRCRPAGAGAALTAGCRSAHLPI
jgi:hypothetical protein